MSQRARAILCLFGFLAVAALVTSDGFLGVRNAVPEGLYWSFFIVILGTTLILGIYSWWQHFNGRRLNPTAERLKDQISSPAWWNWPF
jgi:hypothetical protein